MDPRDLGCEDIKWIELTQSNRNIFSANNYALTNSMEQSP